MSVTFGAAGPHLGKGFVAGVSTKAMERPFLVMR